MSDLELHGGEADGYVRGPVLPVPGASRAGEMRRRHVPAGRALMSAERLVRLFRADCDLYVSHGVSVPVLLGQGSGEPACRCYRCGRLLTAEMVRLDRYGVDQESVRPACEACFGE